MKKLIVLTLCLVIPAQAMDVEIAEISPCDEKLYPIDNVGLDNEIRQLVQEGNLQKIKLFLNNAPSVKTYPGSDYVETNYDKHVLIHTMAIAAHLGKREIIDFLIQNYPFAKCPIPLDQLLRVAAYNNNLDLAKVAIENGANPNGIPEYILAMALPPIFNAAKKGHTAIVQYLIEHGASINRIEIPYGDKSKQYATSALIYALEDEKMDTVEAILMTIPLDEQIKFRNECRGLCSLQRAQPVLGKDMRKVIGQNVVELLAQDHLDYAQNLLINSRLYLQNPNFKISHKERLLAQIENFQRRMQDPQIKKTIEIEIRRLLFAPRAIRNDDQQPMDINE